MTALPEQCGACGTRLSERQRWCLHCGTAAGSVVASTPRWALRSGGVLLLAVVALVGVVYALATLLSS